MSSGRWSDDIWGGEEPTHLFPTPHVHNWLKWSWPGMFAAMWLLSLWIHGAALPVGLGLWVLSVLPFYFYDRRQAVNAEKAASPPKG